MTEAETREQGGSESSVDGIDEEVEAAVERTGVEERVTMLVVLQLSSHLMMTHSSLLFSPPDIFSTTCDTDQMSSW